MARANILNTRTMDFGELIGNGKIYRVPAYQRDYSWAEEQWEDLWSDVVELRAEPNERHYMGAVVVQATTDREFSIIDGQQRTATLSILALAIIERLNHLSAENIDATDNRSRAAELRRAFIGEKDPASLIESSKLFLNVTDDAFYQDYLVQLRAPLNPRRLPKSNRLLWDCLVYFRARIGALEDIKSDGAALARLLNETISRQLRFIVITVEDEINAYTVFETLNARGLELTTTDLLKNYLFSRVQVAADLTALQRRWRTLIATVTAEHFPEFLRYHLQTRIPQVRSRRLYNLVRNETKTPQQVFELMDALEGRAELFVALSDPTHAFWLERQDTKFHIRELTLFRARQMTPVLFAAFERFDHQGFQSVLRALSVMVFRYTIVSDRNTNALEPVFHRAAKAILDGAAATPAQVWTYLRGVSVDDAKFEQDIADIALETSGQRKKLVKYILARLETDASGPEIDFETDPASIEHVLPEHPGVDWDEWFSPDQQDAYVNRLGNLTLLEAGKNRDLGNASFAKKVAAYSTSVYRLTQQIPERAPTEWTPALVDERQKRLARRAVQIWRVDF